MAKALGAQPARQGSLSPGALRDMLVLREFMAVRDRYLEELVGTRLRRSHLRDEIMRNAAIQFGQGRIEHMSYYQSACIDIAGPFAVRDELRRMVGLNLVIMHTDPDDRRSTQIIPTQRLIDFYSEHMPLMVGEFKRIARRYGSSM